jgi:SAM-dependent methyltransferase
LKKTTIDYYNENAALLSIRYNSANVENIHKILTTTFPQKSKLLELGCGSGRDINFMTNKGYDVIGIDGSFKMIQEAKKNHQIIKNKIFCRKVQDLDFKKNSFDGIYSIATLMHLSTNEILITIDKIYDLLKTNGKVVISVSTKRDDINKNGFDAHNRYFNNLEIIKWEKMFEGKFTIIDKFISFDGLNRSGIEWFSCILKKS